MKNLHYQDDTLYMTDYRPVWTLEGIVMEAELAHVPVWARVYTHTDKDEEPRTTQIIFDWSKK